MKKRNPAFLFMLTVMAGTAAVLIALGVILLSLFAGDKKHDGEQRPKSEIIIQTVREHAETILEDIEQNDLERTLAFFDGFREKPHVNREGNCIFFECCSLGFGPSTAYIGFYYTPWDTPAPVAGFEVPWAGYFTATALDLMNYLEPEGNGFAWHEKNESSGGDNVYYTEKIDNFLWYYCLDY